MSLVASEIVVMVITASGAAINDKVYFSAFYTSLVYIIHGTYPFQELFCVWAQPMEDDVTM